MQTSQVRAAVAVNRELILLYWQIGRDILRRQREEGWGTKVIDRLGADLHSAFPDMRGFSSRNLKYMRSLADAFPDEAFVQAPLAQMPWYHAITLLDKVADPAVREWYIRQTIAQGWSRSVLVFQIEAQAHTRQGKALTNFAATLPAPAVRTRPGPAQRPLQLRLPDACRRRPGDAPAGRALGAPP